MRRIDFDTNVIETVAGTGAESYAGDGGPASEAQLARPMGVAFDPYGNLYISDTFNNRIRKVKLTTTPEGPDPILPADYRDEESTRKLLEQTTDLVRQHKLSVSVGNCVAKLAGAAARLSEQKLARQMSELQKQFEAMKPTR